MKFDKLAHGRRCHMAFPGICSGDPAKVVPCHIRRGNVGGIGKKPPPVCIIPGCFECHSAYDGRTKTDYTRDELDAMVLAGLLQWLAWLYQEEYLLGVA